MQKALSVLKKEANVLLSGHYSHLEFYTGYEGTHEVIAHLYTSRISHYDLERFAANGWVIKKMYGTIDYQNNKEECIRIELSHKAECDGSKFINDELYSARTTDLNKYYNVHCLVDRRWIIFEKSYPDTKMFYHKTIGNETTKITIEDDLN